MTTAKAYGKTWRAGHPVVGVGDAASTVVAGGHLWIEGRFWRCCEVEILSLGKLRKLVEARAVRYAEQVQGDAP